jgi:hypothetical protein
LAGKYLQLSRYLLVVRETLRATSLREFRFGTGVLVHPAGAFAPFAGQV